MANVDTPDDQMLSVLYGDHETDDWGGKSQIGLSELASRLNAKQHFDNRGRQIWSDGVETPVLQWNTLLFGGATIAPSNNTCWRSGNSLLFTLPAVPGPIAQLEKYFYNPETGRYSIETAFSSLRNDFQRVEMFINIYDGVTLFSGVLRILGSTGEVLYFDEFGFWISTGLFISLRSDIHFWHKIKLVMDITNGNYLRMLFDGMEFDMEGIPAWSFLSGLGPYISVQINCVGGPLNAQNIYFDDFILSHLEP